METLINKISLTRDEMIRVNGDKFMTIRNTQYYNMLKNLRVILFEERKKYSSDIDFYRSIALQFANAYIPQMINDYGNVLSEETIQKLKNISNGDGLKIFNPGEAIKQGYISVNANGKPSGDDGAFAKSDLGMIGFTPESESSKIDFSQLNIEELCKKFPELDKYNLSKLSVDEIKQLVTIENAVKMLTSMIHETFHLLINVRKDERFYWVEDGKMKHQLTSGGFIIDEGLVDKYATDFANKYGFYHLPSFFYMDFVDLCNEIESRFGKHEFDELAFSSTYDEILGKSLTPEEYKLYQYNERKKYLQKRTGSSVDIILNDEYDLGFDENKTK